MAASLLALLSQQTPNLPTRKGLILTGLQHDFLSPNGKLPVNNLESGFLERTKALIDSFRGHGEIIWIRTEIDAPRHPKDVDEDACNVITSLDQHDQSESEDSDDDASESDTALPSRKRKSDRDSHSHTETQGASKRTQRKSSLSDDAASTDDPTPVDEEHFLTQTASREACFIKGTLGSDFAAEFKRSVQPTDLQVTKTYYSAFSSTSLLSTLRMKLITELYVCGAMTNLNVYATSMDAARYGIKITLVEDCLGYRQKERHDLALKRLVDMMDASVTTSDQVIAAIGGGSAAARPKVTEAADIHTALGADVDAAADMLEVASSDEDDDEDLLSVRASPYKSHGPMEIRGSRPQDKDLQVVDTGSEPHSQFQRHASTESNAGPGTSQRTTKDRDECPSKVEAVELEISHSLKQAETPGKDTQPAAKDRTPTRTAKRYLSTRVNNTHDDTIQVSPNHIKSQQQEKAQKRNTPPRAGRRDRKVQTNSIIERQTCQPLFGIGKEEESSGSSIQYDLLPPDRLDGLFHKLKDEVTWQKMHHQTGEVPRRVSCQGTIGPGGDMPIYRHPSDETIALLPWTSTVDEIRQAAEAIAGHELNHALIQLYRAGTDFISEHSDKTLDICPGSFIVNASFGAERVMRLRTKRAQGALPIKPTTPPTQDPQARTTHCIRLPHNSALLMSLETNARYLHSINPEKRPSSELTLAEKAYDGQRISLTFRQIGTYLDAESEHIWGQGATEDERKDAQSVVNGDAVEVNKLLKGFGAENAAAEIKWAEWYGNGSDVLHLK